MLFTSLIVAAFLVLLFLQIWLILIADAALLEVTNREDDILRKRAQGQHVEVSLDDYFGAHSRHGRYLTPAGIPAPKPNFIWKFKILLGLLQIVTSISEGMQIEWPRTFKVFINRFNPANLG